MKKLSKYFAVTVAVCFLFPTLARAAGGDNPTGVAGQFSGNVTTGCSYDPYTGNATRTVEDMSVTGSVGAYPLKWTRVLNTRKSTGPSGLGRGGWTHSYDWHIWVRGSTNPEHWNDENTNVYEGPDARVYYPDGREVDFYGEPGGPYQGFAEMDTMVYLQPNAGGYDLVFTDGGKVLFRPGPYLDGTVMRTALLAQAIVDPYGQTTSFGRDSAGRLVTITEPAGRYLQINYTAMWVQTGSFGAYYYVITSVQAFQGPGNLVETVSYTYADPFNGSNPYLAQVNYDDGTQASYWYESPNVSTTPVGLISACDDVRFAGPMSRIKYEYLQQYGGGGYYYGPQSAPGDDLSPSYNVPPPSGNPDAAWGQLKAENNLTTGQVVSAMAYPPQNDPSPYYRTETRGDGATRSFQYSEGANILSYTDFQNHSSSMSYPPVVPGNNFFSRIFTDARGGSTTTDREFVAGAVKKITHPDGSYVQFTYTDAANPRYLASRTDERGYTTYYDRDGNNRIWQTRYPDNSVEQFTYNGFGQILTHTMTSGGIETFGYDGRGRKINFTDPLGNVTQYNYYWNDRLLNMVDPRGCATWYEYNQRGQVTKLTHQDGSFIQSTYNPDGTLATSTDELGQTTSHIYDEYKRLTSVTNPLNQTTTSSYAPWSGIGSLSHTTSSVYWTASPMGKTSHFAYDENWRISVRRDAPGTAADAWSYFWYDQAGNLVTTQDPRGYQSNSGYDARNRKVWAMDALNQVTRWYYDAASNVGNVQHADGGWETKTYDAMNRVVNDTDPVGRVTHFDYTASGKVWHVVDGNGQQTTFAYDAADQKTRMTYPNGEYQGWGYDAARNLTSRRTVNGTEQYFAYDNRNRPANMWWSNGVDWSNFYYDAASHLTRAQNWVSISDRQYDAAGRLTLDSQYLPALGWKEVRYEYDTDGRQTRLYLPGAGYDRTYTYDPMGRFEKIFDTGAGSPLFQYSYDASSNETLRYSALNNVGQYYSRDALNRMSQRVVYSSWTGNISVEHYGFDAMSRQTATWRDEDGLTDNFGYDASGQLTSGQYGRTNRWVGYNWDNAGNRTLVNDNGAVNAYTPNTINQYNSVGPDGVSNGTEHEIAGYQGVTYGYYGDTRLASVSSAGNGYNLYYDALGRCVQRTLNGVTTYYIYDGEKPIYEYKADGSTAGWNVYGKGIDEILLRADYVVVPSGQGYFYQQDHEGSVTHLMGWGAEVIESYRYDAFGAPTTTYTGGVFNNRFKFTGREYMPTFGIYEYRNRAYHPGLGRFMSEDPKGFAAGDHNLFRYCGNDPVDRIDPMGEFYTVRENGPDNLTVRIPMDYYGKAATPAVIARFNAGIAGLSDTYRGIKVQFEAYTPAHWWNRTNTVNVRAGEGQGKFGKEIGTDHAAYWYAEGGRVFREKISPEMGARHSVGHFLRLKDGYNPMTGQTFPGFEGNLMDYRPGGTLNDNQINSILHPGLGGTIAGRLGYLGGVSSASSDVRWARDSGTGNWQADQTTNGYLLGGGENSGEGFHPSGAK